MNVGSSHAKIPSPITGDIVFSSNPTGLERVVFMETSSILFLLFLNPGTRYTLRLSSGEEIAIETKFTRLPHNCLTGDIPVDVLEQILIFSPDEYAWTIDWTVDFWIVLLKLGVFTLPHDDHIVLIPNPMKKFCLDVDTMVEKRKEKDLRFVPTRITRDNLSVLESMLRLCRDWHVEFGKSRSSWISERFIKTISRIVCQSTELSFYVFKLIEESSGRITSVSIGYQYGSSFMDFTACTPVRDNRGCGKILIRNQGYYFKEFLEIKLWYLGFKLPYMTSMSGQVELNRQEFQSRWGVVT